MKPNLRRREVVKTLLTNRKNLLVVAGLGSTSWDITAAGDSSLSFPSWGAMGQAAMTGLGLALAQPRRRVLVITGDGEMLMGLGSLATIGVQQPRNLAVIVLDNERYGETGMQLTHTRLGVELAGVAKASGFRAAGTIYSAAQLKTWIPRLHRQLGPVFAAIKVTAQPAPMVLPVRDGATLKTRFREALLGAKALE